MRVHAGYTIVKMIYSVSYVVVHILIFTALMF